LVFGEEKILTEARTISAYSASAKDLARIGVVCDFREEGWPSMELVAEMLLAQLQTNYSDLIDATRIQPEMRFRFARHNHVVAHQTNGGHEAMPNGSSVDGSRFNADRVVNRFWDYPRYIRTRRSDFDVFHIIDHSYGQLLFELPLERTIVTCHDLDTFQCLLNPNGERRSFLFKKMMSRTLAGFRKAARVVCVSQATRDELLSYGLVDPERAIVIANGVDPSMSPNPDPVSDANVDSLIGDATGQLNILHVGSTIPRKRIEVLLRIFASLKHLFPNARLLRVGGAFTTEQTNLADRLGVSESILALSQVERRTLAELYRRATLVLQPSEREGFGLPLVEAMACGTPVVASDIPALREVGGDAATYCETGNVEAWTEAIVNLLTERDERPQAWEQRREAGFTQAAKFSWAEYARKMVAVYQSVLNNTKS
jgi:glycosyltransferase involved in cell wall biosynthesis